MRIVLCVEEIVLRMLEQSLSPTAAAFQRRLVGEFRIDLAADEAVRTADDAASVVQDRAATVINFGHSKLDGPPLQWRRRISRMVGSGLDR